VSLVPNSALPTASDADLAVEMPSVYSLYAALTASLEPAHGLGGRLVYAGRLDAAGSRLLRAANIAGAASLTVSNAAADLRLAVREGVADFLVTSLDEALRILKNEIRKRQPVAVAICAEPREVGEQMMLRGVQPDLLTPDPAAVEPLCAYASFLARGAQSLQLASISPEPALRIWPVPAAWAQRTSQLDALLLAQLPAETHTARRWLRLAPRYLGAKARRLRSVACDDATASKIEAILASAPTT